MFAVIKTGGKQYIVKQGDILSVEKLDAEQGATVMLETLLIAEDDGSKMDVGAPLLASKAIAEIVEHGMGKKVSVVHYKPKVRYRKRVGHRQPFTKIKINSIS